MRAPRPSLLALIAVAAVVALAPPGSTDEEVRCTCPEGNACYHFLGAPVGAPDDPCSCPLCRSAPGSCPKKLPEGWDPICASNRKMECFLRRHAASWRLSCSERLAGTCDCKNPHPEFCPRCGENGEQWDARGLEVVKKQMEVERRIMGPRRRFIIVVSPHFYLVTDIHMLKIRTQSGRIRLMGMHELAHLYAQRAEIAYQDFVREIGKPTLPQRCAIFLVQARSTQEQFQETWFGNPKLEIYYGGGSRDVSGHFAYNGLSESLEDAKRDYDLHLQVRHAIGHILMSDWPEVKPFPPELPKWLHAGVAHWLARLHPRLREMATFCSAEVMPPTHSGKRWDKYVRGMAVRRDVPIQKVLDASWEGMDLDAHIRAWSWFDVFLREDHDRFVKYLRGIRLTGDARGSMKSALGCTPEEFDRRWCDRVLRKRASVAATPAEMDAADPGRPGAEERKGIREETDPDTLAARIRSLQKVEDPLTAATVVPCLGSRSANVRETAVVVLTRTKDPEVKRWLRTEGLASSSFLARAQVARVLGNLGDPEAGPELMKYLGDGFWLTRAHVAFALGRLRHEPGKERLKGMIRDRSPKVRIAVMDALGRFGERAASAWEPVSTQLSAPAWQVRSAAAECLGALGDMRSVEPLIGRMEIESGRIRRDIREALTRITGDDLGENPENWRDWWEKVKERHDGKVPGRPGPVKEPPKGEHTYGEPPTYYGLRVFSDRVGYVLDVSGSMLFKIEIEKDWLKRNRRTYPPLARKFDHAMREIEANLRKLDPRVRFNLYFFRKTAYAWRGELTRAEDSKIEAAIARMAAEEPKPVSNRQQTNYVDAFRLVLDVKKDDELIGGFGDTPDTIYFLTDGRPTTGDITQADTLLSWYTELNRFARVKTNVIAFGKTGVDPVFVTRLAEDNGGTAVLVPEVR